MADAQMARDPGTFDIHADEDQYDSGDEENEYMEGTDPETPGSEEEEGSDSSDAREESSVEELVAEDMEKFVDTFKGIGSRFRLINRIGEGTFSTVYKAEDLYYDEYVNDWDLEHKENHKWSSPPLKKRRTDGSTGMQRSQGRRGPQYVAIKKIYVTSSPHRIQNELELLHDLRGCDSVCPLITAFRHLDQVVAVLPYFRHVDFREYFRDFTVADMRVYFRSLFTALDAVHTHDILHRDIKPTNFLYDIHRRRGVLVDFGLAEREGTDSSHCTCQNSPAARRNKLEASGILGQPPSMGYPKDDQRPSRRANRAGTRGFRAPEVLFKCTAQTSKIDIWSAGVILITMLARRFPFFNSADDIEAMIEIATIFGARKMRACALLHNTVFETSIPTIGERGFSLEKIVLWSTGRTGTKSSASASASTASTATEPAAGNTGSDGGNGETSTLTPDEAKAVRFLGRCLELDPARRISAAEALQHDFLACAGEDEPEGMDLLS
ncbi:MAG: hypothetical protein M1838_005336 [Thelocarpon superellum]|nr:MAG: hypothetical protein M1838_005336 [Thelocarpon superellum]